MKSDLLAFFHQTARMQTLGAAGNPIVKTPVLDALAKEGVRFTENCVTTSICWISRATLYR
jgi:arylsulfatase A-like enzyme